MSLHALLLASHVCTPAYTAALAHICRGRSRMAIVTTAAAKLKERNPDSIFARSVFRPLVPEVTDFDLDVQDAHELTRYDLVYLANGNPLYLLHRIRATEADDVLEQMAADGCPMIACGAAAAVLGRTTLPVAFFDSATASMGCRTAAALGLVPFALLPNADRWRSRHADYQVRVARCEMLCGCEIVQLNDDEALRIKDNWLARVPLRAFSPSEVAIRPEITRI